MTVEQLSLCGANYCPLSKNENVALNSCSTFEEEDVNDNFETDLIQVYTLAGVYLVFSLLGPLIIALFVDPISRCFL